MDREGGNRLQGFRPKGVLIGVALSLLVLLALAVLIAVALVLFKIVPEDWESGDMRTMKYELLKKYELHIKLGGFLVWTSLTILGAYASAAYTANAKMLNGLAVGVVFRRATSSHRRTSKRLASSPDPFPRTSSWIATLRWCRAARCCGPRKRVSRLRNPC